MCSSVRRTHYLWDEGPLILDGGLGTELEAQGANIQGDPLWTARLLLTNPQAIRDAHQRFLVSGADVITTATYQATVTGFISHLDMSSEDARELLMSGVHLGKETVKTFVSDSQSAGQRCPLVAGSIGPYGAFLHNGSEYTGAYAEEMSVEVGRSQLLILVGEDKNILIRFLTSEFKDWHRPQVGCLVAAGTDLIAFETIPSTKEAEALVELLREFPNSKAWLSFSCKDGKCISDGSPFADAVQIANRSSQLLAVGVNCCPPVLVEQLLDSAKSLLCPNMCWVVYPNSGEDWDAERQWHTAGKTSESISELSATWMEQGAALIGGCCRIGPAHIAELKQKLNTGTGLKVTS